MDLVLKNALSAYGEADYSKAIKYFNKIKDPKKDYYLGLTYVRLEDYTTAIMHLKKYLKTEVDYQLIIQVYLVLGYIYAQKKEFIKSKKQFEKALSLDFHNAKANAALGFVEYKLKNYQSAIKSLKKAIEIDETNATAHNSLGYIYADINMSMEESIQECEIALKLSPDYAAYMDSMGWAYYKKGDLIKAKEYLTKALDKLPENEEIRKHFKDLILKEMAKKKETID
ncbi:MAG: tetratricopeptide repeat protein [Spirochaetes bacterium]|nr:tetratricopeptide repeat protein [Spirochaetota bacterium]